MGQLVHLLTPPKNDLTQLTPISLWLEPGDPTLEHDVLDKVDLSGCTDWDPKDQQQARQILRGKGMFLLKMISISGEPQL